MAYGDIILVTVGYTASDAGSQRKNYPIKQKYKQTTSTKNPIFPSSYTLYGAQKYWLPYALVAPSDEDYIVYTSGDEYAWNDSLELRPVELRFADPNLRKYRDYEFGRRIVYANDIYEATNYYFNWTDTKFLARNNPYKTNRVRKWKKLSDTSTTWVQYWYHPLLKRFYLVANTDQLQELPNFDEPNQSRWDSFVGDSADLNIENFTLAQIRELISRGQTTQSAQAAVNNLEQRVLSSITIPSATRTYTLSGSSSTFTITNTAYGQEGTSSSQTLEGLPSMFQREKNSKTGVKEIVDRYHFNLRPNNISYTNIGANWADIERVNNYPIVDYRNPKLMKISFEFLVEAHSGNISSNYESCETQLLQLRRMASRAELVQFTNFDSMFGETVNVSGLDSNAREFAIVEMTISSVLRTPLGESSIQGEISRATVNMTIQEVHTSKEETIFMPKISKDPQTPGGGGTPTGDPQACQEKLSRLLEPALDAKKVCTTAAS